MLILRKNTQNTLTLNLNNNSRTVFSTYLLKFTHISSQTTKEYTVDTSDPAQYGCNSRFCELVLNLQLTGNDLIYAGQYLVEIYGDSTILVYTGMANVLEKIEVEPFIEYRSDNEDNENYIYTN